MMARRQEQEQARTEVTEVAPNVLRLELPISMPGLGHVNCYAILDKNGAAVVDPGLPGPSTWRAITDRLRRADLAVKHVHTVLVTHSHPDHFGGASRFAKESGAQVIQRNPSGEVTEHREATAMPKEEVSNIVNRADVPTYREVCLARMAVSSAIQHHKQARYSMGERLQAANDGW